MTGNVAQVFITDEAWAEALASIRQVLKPRGHLVFEVRDPAKQAWLKWTREKTYKRLEISSVGFVDGWCDVTSASEEYVSFRWTYIFESDGTVLSSDSTLRFRSRDAIIRSLQQAEYIIDDIRDAPDRPEQEFIVIASAV